MSHARITVILPLNISLSISQRNIMIIILKVYVVESQQWEYDVRFTHLVGVVDGMFVLLSCAPCDCISANSAEKTKLHLQI